MVQLAAEACVMEGGAATTATPVMPVVTDASLHLSADPKLADAQRAVADLLIKPVRHGGQVLHCHINNRAQNTVSDSNFNACLFVGML